MKILVLSDIHGKKSPLPEILKSTGLAPIDAIIVAGDLTSRGSRQEALELLGTLSVKELLCVPGNLDSRDALEAMEESGKSLHCRKRKLLGTVFCGMGGGLAGGAGEILFTEAEIMGKLLGLAEEGCVLVTHLPPKNSTLDNAGGRHIGSSAVREIISLKKPSIHLCGHAHGSRNTEWIGGTLCVNPGPASEGCAAIVDTGKSEAELV